MKTEALLRCSHGLLVVTASLLRRGENVGPLTIANAMFARLQKMRIWPLLVDVEIQDFKKAFPFYASFRPVQFGRSQVAEVVKVILNKIASNLMGILFVEEVLSVVFFFRAEDSGKRVQAARAPSPTNYLLTDRLGGLPPKVVDLKGRKKELKKILDEFCPGSPYCWISGQPGIGKSSLAIHVAHKVMKRKCNVIYIDAQTLESETDISIEILRNAQQYAQRVESGRSFSNQDKIENLYIGKKESRSRGKINVIY